MVGVETKTLLRWLQVPEFQTAFRTARRAVGQAVARLQQSTDAAVTTLLKVKDALLVVDDFAPSGRPRPDFSGLWRKIGNGETSYLAVRAK